MPEYTPVESDAVDFGLETHDPPVNHRVHFNLGVADLIDADAVTLELSPFEASASVEGAAPLEADAATLTFESDADLTGDGTVPLDAGAPTPLSLTPQEAQTSYAVSPSPVNLSLDLGEAWFAAGNWIIDSKVVRAHPDFEVDASTISLTFDVGGDAIDHWRAYDRAEDVEVNVGYGGEFEVLGLSSGDIVRAAPPMGDMPPLDGPVEWVVDAYEEEQRGGGRYRISLDLHRVEPREPTFDAPNQTGEWTFETSHGTIGVDAWQVAPIAREGGPSGGDLELTLYLTDAQAIGIVDAAVVPDAVVDRGVPGGEGFAIDTSDGTQTVVVDAPSDAGVSDGTYLAREWTLTRRGSEGERWGVELELAQDG